MKNLLYKELTMALHPTTIIFIFLSAMLLIPNYPYYVLFFYGALGIYFICLTGRENNDILYSMLLPLRKKDIVKARVEFIVLVEVVQAIFCIPFVFIRRMYLGGVNEAGIDANIAFFGLAFLMLGIFNLIFISGYYKNPQKIGKPFLLGSIAIFIFLIIAEGSVLGVPAIKNTIDTRDPEFLSIKLIVLVVGIILYVLLTLLSYKKAVKRFELLDL